MRVIVKLTTPLPVPGFNDDALQLIEPSVPTTRFSVPPALRFDLANWAASNV